MKKLLNILAAGLALASLAACDLDEYPHNAIALKSGESMIASASDLNLWEITMHSRFRGCQMGGNTVATEVMLDGFNATVWYGNNYGGIHRVGSDFNSGDGNASSVWANNYSAINQFNLVIEQTDLIEDESLAASIKTVQGYAYYYRAYCYLTLARYFGKDYNPSTASSDLSVPVVLKYDQIAKPERETNAGVYAQIKKDLDEAASRLEGVAGSARSLKPTIDAVNALYARYYLDVEDYPNAAKYADLVIDSEAGYALAKDQTEFNDEFRNDNGKEAIFQMYASQSELPNGMGTFTSAAMTDEEGLYFTPYFLPSKRQIERYEASDLRLKNWFDNTVKIRTGTISYVGTGTYVFVRFLGNPELYTTAWPQSYQKIKPATLSEMYLIAAEAYLGANDATSAKARLNALQASRGASQTAATLANVQQEWNRETIGLGLRLSCYKRWGLGYSDRAGQESAINNGMLMTTSDDFLAKSLPASDSKWVWPIPKHDMQANKNLVQNPGY